MTIITQIIQTITYNNTNNIGPGRLDYCYSIKIRLTSL